MPWRTRTTLVAIGSLLAALSIGYTVSRSAEGGRGRSRPSGQDLSSHPVYSQYRFGTEERVIDFGVQPLWIPANLIAETMRRDGVLAEVLSAAGLEIRFHSFLKGADVNYFLDRGDLEVAIGGDMPALSAAVDIGVVVAALVHQGFCSIVAHDPLLIEELRNRRVAFPFGSSAHHALLSALAQAGLGETDVDLVPLDVNEMPEALREGRIDAFAAWEPISFIAENHYPDQVIVHRSLCSGYLYFSHSFADRYPEATRQIVAAELRAMNWLKQAGNLVKAGRWALAAGKPLSSRFSRLTPEDCAELARKDLLGITAIPAIPQADLIAGGRLSREFEFLKSLGKIGSAIDWEQARLSFDRSLVRKVLTAAKAYELRRFEYGGDDRASE